MDKNLGMIKQSFNKQLEEYEKNKERIERERYESYLANPINMSFWLPKIKAALSKSDANLKIPETEILTLDQKTFDWLKAEPFNKEKVDKFGELVKKEMADFLKNKSEVFVKTGVYSDKFTFANPHCKNLDNIGENMFNVLYFGWVVGANETVELVARDYIQPPADTKEIYGGMPLRTEFRVFYDFDKKQTIGVSNYWHEDYMSTGVHSAKDKETFNENNERIKGEFQKLKHKVIAEVDHLCGNVKDISGQWSVDVMKSGDDYWLIDMATMNRSALVDVMESL